MKGTNSGLCIQEKWSVLVGKITLPYSSKEVKLEIRLTNDLA